MPQVIQNSCSIIAQWVTVASWHQHSSSKEIMQSTTCINHFEKQKYSCYNKTLSHDQLLSWKKIILSLSHYPLSITISDSLSHSSCCQLPLLSKSPMIVCLYCIPCNSMLFEIVLTATIKLRPGCPTEGHPDKFISWKILFQGGWSNSGMQSNSPNHFDWNKNITTNF